MVTITYTFETVQVANLLRKALKDLGIKVKTQPGAKFFVDMLDAEYIKSLSGQQQAFMMDNVIFYLGTLDESEV